MASTIITQPPREKINSIIKSINDEYNKSVQKLVNYRNASAASILNSRINLIGKRLNIQALDRNFRLSFSKLIDIRAKSIETYRTKYRALIIGCNYRNTPHELSGCIKDANSIKTFLSEKGTKSQTIFTMTDDSDIKPTKDNILQAFTDLLERSVAGETVVFAYSGHGSLVDSKTPKTINKDNVLISLDLKEIVDNELNSIIRTHLKKDVTLLAFFDCCHSRTMFDLHYNYDINAINELESSTTNELVETKTEISNQTSTPDTDSRGDTIGQVFCISGCLDEQTSSEATIEGITQGALTWAYLKTMTEHKEMSWKKLISRMQRILKKSTFTQIPQFSSGIKCDLNSLCLYSL